MMLIKKRRALPKWLFATGLILLLISSLTGTLVYAARQQPADDQRCLKISPDGGDFSYVYFDVSSGTRLNMPRHTLDGSYEQISGMIPSPDGSKGAMLIRSTVAPISKIILENLINGSRKMGTLSVQNPLNILWSNDSNYIATTTHKPDLDDVVIVISVSNLKEMVNIPASAIITSWAPRSNRLAFIEHRRDQSYWLSILNVNTPDDASRLTSVRLPDDTQSGFVILQWSPDEQYIAVQTMGDMGVASANGSTFQMISHEVLMETWAADTMTLAYIEVDDNSMLKVYDSHAQTSKILASNIGIFGSKFSPDGRHALLSNVGSAGDLTFRIMNLATGDAVLLGTSNAQQKTPQIHWYGDSQIVVVVTADKVLWADLRNPLLPIVHETPIENLSYWDFLPDNSWMRGVSQGGPFDTVPQYLNLKTGERYLWQQTNTGTDKFLSYWPKSIIAEPIDMLNGTIKRVTSVRPYATVDLESGPIPWLVNVNYLINIDNQPDGANQWIVYVRRTDGTLLWTVQGPGYFSDDPAAVRWINCQTLR